MKKALSLILAIALCLTALWGCTQNVATDNGKERFCRVVCLKDNGIVVWIEGLEYVYVKHVNPELNIQTFATVVMSFSDSDLKSASGTFHDISGRELSYSYILEEPSSIRFPDPAKGEPTFG